MDKHTIFFNFFHPYKFLEKINRKFISTDVGSIDLYAFFKKILRNKKLLPAQN